MTQHAINYGRIDNVALMWHQKYLKWGVCGLIVEDKILIGLGMTLL